jgi:hypothetical protein
MTRKNKEPNKNFDFQPGDAILTVLFFTSIGLTVWGINIYRLTIIDIEYLFMTICFGVIISSAILTWLIKSSYSTIWTFLIKAGIGGGLFYFALLFINQQFADKEFLTEQFLIVKKGTLGRGKSSSCFQPYVDIDFYGTEKQLVFYCDFADAVKHSTKVNLTYSKGAFGFNIIKSKQLAD